MQKKECYKYANKALELDSKASKAWLIKMRALDNMGTIENRLRLDEFHEVGLKAVENADGDENITNKVYSLFLLKAKVIMNFCDVQIRNVGGLVNFDGFKNVNDALKSASKQDEPFCQAIDYAAKKCVDIKNSVPKEFICSEQKNIDIVVEIAKSWVSYSEGYNNRLNIYGFHLLDSAVEARKHILELIKQGLPEEVFSNVDVTKINNKEGAGGGCYVATAVYGSYDCPEVWTLRRFRDFTLDETWYGRLFIKSYYATSPTFVKYFGNVKLFKLQGKKLLDKWVAKLNSKGYESTPYKDKY